MGVILKLFFALLGYKLFGVAGAIIAIFLALLFENAKRHGVGRFSFHFINTLRAQQAFFSATFEVMGCIAKADGRVSEREIQVAQMIMDQMGLVAASKQKAIDAFTRGKQADFNLNKTLRSLQQACHYPHLLNLFIDMQIRAAYADGHLNEAKRTLLQHIARELGLSAIDFAAHEAAMRGEASGQSYEGAYRSPGANASFNSHKPYTILGISPQASDAEVKQAYRKLMSQNHPDKLMAKGLPQDMLKVATEKTQQIQKAYEQIKSMRGL
jgi:DnaJ like chaperone protein